MRYVMVEDGRAARSLEIPGGLDPKLIDATGDWLASDAPLGWLFDGEAFVPPRPPTVDLASLKATLRAAVDAAAEAERMKYITAGAGQAMTYQQKASEAVMLEDDPAPEPSDYPLLSAEVGITAPTLAEVGAAVRQAHGRWILLGAQIEAVRLGGKKDIDAAEDAASALAAANVAWPQPGP